LSRINIDVIRLIKAGMVKLTEHVARTREKENAYRNLVWKPEGKSPFGRPRNREENNIKIKLKGIGWKGVN
jgi:hypothetical protein